MLSNSIVTSEGNKMLSESLEVTDLPEIKPGTVQGAETAGVSVQHAALIQALKRKIKSSMEHLTK